MSCLLSRNVDKMQHIVNKVLDIFSDLMRHLVGFQLLADLPLEYNSVT